MAMRLRSERIALFIALPLLIVVTYVTWRIWEHVRLLEDSLAQSKQTEISLLAQVRDAVGREALAGKALRHTLEERDLARTEAEQFRVEAASAQQEAARQRDAAERLRSQRRAELDRMRDALGLIAETDRTPMGMVVQLSEESFLFDFDSAELGSLNREILSRIAGVLLASYGYKVYVYGHTDDQGDEDYNVALSERRARSVLEYLVSAGIPREILEAQGFGQASPRVPGSSREARRKNRRVEVGIVDTVIDYGSREVTEPPR